MAKSIQRIENEETKRVNRQGGDNEVTKSIQRVDNEETKSMQRVYTY